jgi:Na+:H+ antiporter, NhaA family
MPTTSSSGPPPVPSSPPISGLLLLLTSALALAWANSRWAEGYRLLWHTPLGIKAFGVLLEPTLAWFVNDALMVLFFFFVGLEIRRELHHGVLSEWRRAVLPLTAALGGMLVPAGVYLALTGPSTMSGWGVPVATDIAFAVGILALLGNRVPAALRILLLALAVIDDLGAIVVIALFYSSSVALSGLMVAALGFGAVLAMQRLGIRKKLAYVVPALVTWGGVYAAGVHPTIAGVLVGLVTPLNVAPREVESPSESLSRALKPWVAFGIMPVFALANAGVTLSGDALDASSARVALGVAAGLVVGKPTGILLATWLALKLGLGQLPPGLTARHLLVLGLVAGVGFTMAIFIAQLAFTDTSLLAGAKLGVLAASGVAAVLALATGRALLSAAGENPPTT